VEVRKYYRSIECNACYGTGRMVRDPDIGTDQECFVCEGSGALLDSYYDTNPDKPYSQPCA
jgi:DnaJ-class molecular chaperone